MGKTGQRDQPFPVVPSGPDKRTVGAGCGKVSHMAPEGSARFISRFRNRPAYTVIIKALHWAPVRTARNRKAGTSRKGVSSRAPIQRGRFVPISARRSAPCGMAERTAQYRSIRKMQRYLAPRLTGRSSSGGRPSHAPDEGWSGEDCMAGWEWCFCNGNVQVCQ